MRTYSVFIRLIVVVVGQREMDLKLVTPPPKAFLPLFFYGLYHVLLNKNPLKISTLKFT